MIQLHRTVAVPLDDGNGAALYEFSDLLRLEPPALFSERRAMAKMGPIRLALHLLSRTLYFRGIRHHTRHHGPAVRVWLWMWRIERRTWPA